MVDMLALEFRKWAHEGHGKWALDGGRALDGRWALDGRKALGGVGDAPPLLGKQANQDKREVRKDYPLLLVLEYLGRDIYNHLEGFQS